MRVYHVKMIEVSAFLWGMAADFYDTNQLQS